jgi:hypothetical protein
MFVLFKLTFFGGTKNACILWIIRSWSFSWFVWSGRFWLFNGMVHIHSCCQHTGLYQQSTKQTTAPLTRQNYEYLTTNNTPLVVIFLSKKQLKLNFA